jgi:hypothetical protein
LSKRLCNGCYGRLLSLYEIKAGTAADDQKAEELAAALLSTVTLDLQQRAESIFRISEKRGLKMIGALRGSRATGRCLTTPEYRSNVFGETCDRQPKS